MTRSIRRLIAIALLTVAGAGALSAVPSHSVAILSGGPLAVHAAGAAFGGL